MFDFRVVIYVSSVIIYFLRVTCLPDAGGICQIDHNITFLA